METSLLKNLLVDSPLTLRSAVNSEIHSPIYLLTPRSRQSGIRIRHHHICKRCRRFKLKYFYGSFPPKNFCICNSKLPLVSYSVSQLSSRFTSANFRTFMAKGTSICTKSSETPLRQTRISSPLPKKSQEEAVALKSPLRFSIFPGNNSNLVRSIILKNTDWVELDCSKLLEANFIWQPALKNIIFRKIGSKTTPQVLNHFECQAELSNKLNLLKNLAFYCKEKDLDLFSIVPVTFPLDLKSKNMSSQVKNFISYFKSIEPNTQSSLSGSLNAGQNIWLIKPAENNRGTGIKIFKKLLTFKSLMTDYLSGKAQNKSSQGIYVIQKYIENPLLINNRKFDIRVWVLITNTQSYFYNQGYIRTSSELFSLKDSCLNDNFIHLTNNAIQKNSPQYSKYEQGNQISFQSFQDFFSGSPDFDFSALISSIKSKVSIAILSCLPKLNPHSIENCFEIFGFDFIVDSSFKPWLIECNTNPCIELSSPLLEKLIPDMLNEAFSLAVPCYPDGLNSNWQVLNLLNL